MTTASTQARSSLRQFISRGLRERLTPSHCAFRFARYGLSALGPIAVSGANFLASLIFLHELPQAQFGLFSFLLIIVPFCTSVSGAMLGASVSVSIAQWQSLDGPELATHCKVSLLLSLVASLVVGATVLAGGTGALASSLMAAFAFATTLRWFGRSFSFASGAVIRAAGSDVLYSLLLVGGLGTLFVLNAVSEVTASAVLALAAAFSIPVFGRVFVRRQLFPGPRGSFSAYWPVWMKLSRWSLLGVALSEITANAHAYLVTFISGPKAFALLAVGSLMMRPVSLALNALPDIERPRMARELAAGRIEGALKSVKEFRTAVAAIWLAAIALAGLLLVFLPRIFDERGYEAGALMAVVSIWALIMAVRTFRTPESVLLQAAREFQPLAGASTRSSVISLVTTLTLLLTWGPLYSLLGILAGEIAMTSATISLARRWKLAYA